MCWCWLCGAGCDWLCVWLCGAGCAGRLCGVVIVGCVWLVCSGVAVSVLIGCVVLAGFCVRGFA